MDLILYLNIDVALTNGTTCLVKKLGFRVLNSIRCSIIWVEFETQQIGSKARTRYAHNYNEHCIKLWTPIFDLSRNFNVGQHPGAYIMKRQFPLRLVCAKTIHKSQGSTMVNAELHFGKRKQEHIHYVGLNRIRKLEDVYTLELSVTKIVVSSVVSEEMYRLREHFLLHSCVPILSNILEDLKIGSHNCRSL